MSGQKPNIGIFPRSPYEIGVEAGKTTTVTFETMYTTTDGQSTFPYTEVDFSTAEIEQEDRNESRPMHRKLIRRPDFLRGYSRGRQQTQQEEQ